MTSPDDTTWEQFEIQPQVGRRGFSVEKVCRDFPDFRSPHKSPIHCHIQEVKDPLSMPTPTSDTNADLSWSYFCCLGLQGQCSCSLPGRSQVSSRALLCPVLHTVVETCSVSPQPAAFEPHTPMPSIYSTVSLPNPTPAQLCKEMCITAINNWSRASGRAESHQQVSVSVTYTAS